jgi:hypothetical protein
MSDLVYVVTERSAVGDTVLGVFSTIEDARRVLPPYEGGRLEDYQVQVRVLGAPPEPRTPWSVGLSRSGAVESCEIAVT